MIGRLSGIVIDHFENGIVLEAGGVGYEVFVPQRTWASHCQNTGQNLTLYTHLIVREDAHTLYGFEVKPDKAMFQCLLKANGVGPKLAMGLLSNSDSQQLAAYIGNQDTAALTKLPGIGKKTAERLMIDLQGKLNGFEWSASSEQVAMSSNNAAPSTAIKSSALADAVYGLISLGYKSAEAESMARAVFQKELKSAEIIRLALKKGVNINNA